MWQAERRPKLHCFGSWLSGLPSGIQGRLLSMPKLLQRLQFARAEGSIIKELAKLEKLNFLVLDDWGLQPLDTPAKLSLLQLIENRQKVKFCVIKLSY